ncbi:MAG TPA: CRTAC1 family protein [Bryobacteraceae bacterium]|nr:CRTAC1 family protein [Bryobacteraceae bacterium]
MSAAGAVLPLFSVHENESQNVTFEDVAGKAGIRTLTISGGKEKNYVLEVNGSGVCWFDYNNDGYVDLYMVNGSTLEQLQHKSRAPGNEHNHLYRNNGNGTFTDVTESAHTGGNGWGFGCAAADYDNDGKTDLLVTTFGPNILYHNNGDGTFTDVSNRSGLAGGNIWHTGAAFADYDGDGLLDVYIAGYLDFNVLHPELKTCEYRGVQVHACGPLGYKGAPDALYHNNGDGTFTDVTVKAKVVDRALYFGFSVVFEDLDGDDRPDIFVANDSNPNYFYRNRGDGTFEENAVAAGLAYNSDGKEMSSMGVAVGDYDNDGRTDLFVTTFANDNYVLFHNDGKGLFSDVSFQSGVGESTVSFLGWGAFFLDYDNDGFKDLFAANGHVYPEVDGKLNREVYREPLLLFHNSKNGKFQESDEAAGLRRLPAHSARGAAYCDYDNDGDLDIAVSNIDERPQLLRNEGGNRKHWLEMRLVGTTSNRDAIGARVKVRAGEIVQWGRVRTGGSYISGNDLRLHFGLEGHDSVDSVEIRWPSGATEKLGKVPANRILTIQEGKGVVRSLNPPKPS